MRLFLAIDIPAEVKKQITKQISHLQEEYPQLSWIPEENYHVTVRFFGEVEDVSALTKKLEDVLWDAPTFNMFGLEANIFIQSTITLYLVFKHEKKLDQIANNLREKLDLGDNKRFVPHITIARYRIPSKQQYLYMKKKLLQTELDFSFPVKELILFESLNNGNRPKYKPLVAFPLHDEL